MLDVLNFFHRESRKKVKTSDMKPKNKEKINRKHGNKKQDAANQKYTKKAMQKKPGLILGAVIFCPLDLHHFFLFSIPFYFYFPLFGK